MAASEARSRGPHPRSGAPSTIAMENRMSLFHGTTARGWKGMDYFYFFMNSNNKLPPELTCAGGRTSHEVTNYIQTRGSLLPPRLRISRQHSRKGSRYVVPNFF